MKSAKSPLPTPQEEDLRFVRPFFALVVISLIVTYGFTIFTTPAMHDPLRLVIFTTLILISGALHWMFTTMRIAMRMVVNIQCSAPEIRIKVVKITRRRGSCIAGVVKMVKP